MITQKNNNRNIYWDNIKGLLIFLVVFAHILYQLQDKAVLINTVVDCIFMFHMPAFAFVSGCFGKSVHSRSFEYVVRLLFIYFIFDSILGFVDGFVSLLWPMYSYWYILALIFWRLTAHRISKFKLIIPFLLITALIAGFYTDIDNTFAIAKIIGFYPFYMLGYLHGERLTVRIKSLNLSKRIAFATAFLIISSVVIYFAFNTFAYSDWSLQMFNYATPFDAIGRIFLFIIAILCIICLCFISIDKKIPFISEFGQNSLWIFVLHRPITLWVYKYISIFSPFEIVVLAFLISILICLLLGNRFMSNIFNKFAADGADIFVLNDIKINFSFIAFILICSWYVLNIVINYFHL